MLVIDGELHPRFSPGGVSRHIRTGVGIAADGTAWLAISDEVACAQALYLDGSM